MTLTPTKNYGRSKELTRQSILRISAELFASQGYTATTTRLIAEKVGIQQPTLYHYFPHKHAILAELLVISVRPSIEIMQQLNYVDDKSISLYPMGEFLAHLTASDIKHLCNLPIAVAALYRLPEVSEDEFREFHDLHAQLCRGYGEIAAQAAMHDRNDPKILGESIITLVEHISTVYHDKRLDYPGIDSLISDAVYLILSMLGYSPDQINTII